MKKEHKLLFGILLLGLALRLPSINRGDFAFTYDTGRDLLAVRDILGGNLRLIGPTTGVNGIFYGPWWYWFLTIPFILFRGNPIGITAWIALSGAVAAGLGFVWGTRFGGLLFGSVIGFLLAGSVDIVKLTNQLWSPDLLVFATVVTTLFLFQIHTLHKTRLMILGFCLGILLELEIVYGVLFILGFLLSWMLWVKTKDKLIKTLYLLVGIVVTQAPRIFFDLRHNFIQSRTLFSELQTSGRFFFQPKRTWLIYENLSSVLPGEPWMKNILLIVAIYILITSWKKFSKEMRQLLLVLGTIIGLFWGVLFVYPKDFWNYYITGLPVLYTVFLGAIGLTFYKRFGSIATFGIVLYVLLLIQPARVVGSVLHPYFVGDAAVYRNQREVLEYIRAQNPETFKYIAYNPAQHDYNWQYLFWRYKKIGMLPTYTENNPSLMFVILEPDDAYPDRLKEWLKIRERDGTTLREIDFPSGIKVQVRRLHWNE